MYSVLLTKPILVFPLENGMTQNQVSLSKTSKVIRVPSVPSDLFTSFTCVKIDEWAGKAEGLSKSNNLGNTRPYPLESIIKLACMVLVSPSLVFTVVLDEPS